PVLRRLHPRAALRGGLAVHVPVRGPGHGPQGAAAWRRHRRRPGLDHPRRVGHPGRPVLRAALRGDRPAAQGGDVRPGRLIHTSSTVVGKSWTDGPPAGAGSWTTALDAAWRAPTVVVVRGGR